MISLYGKAAITALGFFWKAGWAFVLGYAVSGMIQAFVPKGRLTPYMGRPDFKAVSLSALFGAASSSCSFAALATARALFMKGAHFIAAVAFMFASTNLVIELGVLILIFLGWQYLAAEIIGGVLLIAVSTVLMRLLYPKRWIEEARENISKSGEEEEDFDWRERIASREGWWLVGNRFVSDWKMVWEEILIGFTIAGFVAVLVPAGVWEAIFLVGRPELGWLRVVENALVAPFVAACTFIGSMGNIPLATVLDANGVIFAGIMGFIYSDLMVPPLVAVNAKYYGWPVALYVAVVMYVSIVITALTLHYAFGLTGLTPQSGRAISSVSRFALDYTFWLNCVFVLVSALLVFFNKKHLSASSGDMKSMSMGGGITLKRAVAYISIATLVGGVVSYFITS